MFHVPLQYKVTRAPYNAFPATGNNGFFEIPMENGVVAFIVASDGMDWEHVSVSVKEDKKSETPTWDEMCFIKNLFWDAEDCVMQIHPPESDYVNMHKHTLHLWRPTGAGVTIPRPNPLMVGLPSKPTQANQSGEKSNRGLERLKHNHAGIMFIAGKPDPVNYGVIKITATELVYLNNKGLTAIRPVKRDNFQVREKLLQKFNQGQADELLKEGFAEVVKLDDIEQVFF